MQPFVDLPLVPTTLMDRIRRRLPPENASREVRSILARSDTLSAVSSDEVDAVLAKYRSGRELASGLEGIYRDYFQFVIRDEELSDTEVADLLTLKELLGLPEHTVTTIRNEIVRSIYHRSLEDALRDGQLDAGERAKLSRLESNLGVSAGVVERVTSELASARLQKAWDSALHDQRLSPEEERDLAEMARSLGISVSMTTETRAKLERARLYWQIENAELPAIDPGIALPRAEICHFRTPVEWHEHRRVTKAYRYSGPTARVRIAKGVYWRVGQVGVQRIAKDELTLIDSGTAYLTNKRVLFQGARGNKTLRFSSIIDFTPYRDGIDLQKDSGKSPFLAFEEGVDVFALILNRLLYER